MTNEHYTNGNALQPVDYIAQHDLSFDEGNVIKYVTRHRKKNGKEDILKAIDYCTFILQHQYGLTTEDINIRIIEMLKQHETGRNN